MTVVANFGKIGLIELNSIKNSEKTQKNFAGVGKRRNFPSLTVWFINNRYTKSYHDSNVAIW